LQRADRQARDKAAAQHLRALLGRVLERCVSAAIRCDRVAPDHWPDEDKGSDHRLRCSNTGGGLGFGFDQEKLFNHRFNPANSGCADFYPSDLGVCGLAFSDP
jgi:hypothetical protein